MLLFPLVLVVLLAGIGWSETALTEQDKLKLIQQQLKENQEKLKVTKVKQQEVLGKLVVITQELRKANRQLNQAKGKIQENVSKIGELSVEIRKSEEDLRLRADVLRRRLREAYKSGNVSYIDLLIASRSMSDFLNRLYYFEKVITRDAKLINGVKQDLTVSQVQKKDLANRTAEIKELAQVIAEQKKKAAEQAEEKKKALDDLKAREEETLKKIEELERSSLELEGLIQKKVAERTKAGIFARGTGKYIWPMKGRITSRFGAYRRWGRARHTGLDVAAPYGTQIVAADSGEVIFSGWWDGYGKAVVIDHGKGWSTVYGHMSRIYSSTGTTVAQGQVIGLCGSTGYSTGPHVHFEVRKNGKVLNPEKYLP